MKTLLIGPVVALALMLPSAAMADSWDLRTGHDLYEVCRQPDDSHGYWRCLGFLSVPREIAVRENFCDRKVTLSRSREIFLSWALLNRDKLEKDAFPLAMIALLDAWPCRK
jgi:hypothetical protein